MKINKTSLVRTLLVGSLCCIPLSLLSKTPLDDITVLEQEKSITNIYRAYFPDQQHAIKASITFHNQLLESHLDKGYLVLELEQSDIEKLKSFNFKIRSASKFIKERNQRLSSLQEQMRQFATSSNPPSIQTIPGYECYETVEETLSIAQAMETNNPNIAEYIDIGDSWEKTQGLGGYDLKVLKLTNKSLTHSKPKLLINSAIHAREYTTAPLNLEFARWLVNGYGTNADATWILDHHEVHLLLQTNPDGRKKAEAGSSWRKNTNQNYCGSTSSSRGADLNRNFSSRWNITNGGGSSGNECSSTYRGPSAASEPEVQALEAYARSIFPDMRGPNDTDAAPLTTSGIHIDIHSYSELVLWSWGDKNQPAPNGTGLQTLGRKFAFFNNYMPQQSIGLYATDGTSDNISYGELGVPGITFELGTSFFQNCSTYNNTIKPNNLPALIYAAKAVRTPYVTPAGPDVTTFSLSDDASGAGVPAGTSVTVNASATDLRFSTRNGTESTQNISAAEYYIDTPPWMSGATAYPLSAADGSFNNKTESVTGVINTTGLNSGNHIVYIRAKDSTNTFGAFSAVFLKITDDTPPVVDAQFTSTCTLLQCSFDASSSTGTISTYQWDFGDNTSGVGRTIIHDFSAAGSFNVTLTVTDNNGETDSLVKTVSVSSDTGNALTNGVPKTGLSGNKNDEAFFTLEVPATAKTLNFVITGGSGDSDLYIKFGSKPTTSSYDCRPYKSGNEETCTVTNIQSGIYHVMLRAYSAYSSVKLTGTYTEGGGTGGSFSKVNLSDSASGWQHFSVQIPANMSTFTIDISGGTGDADLYIRRGTQPTTTAYDCRPYKWGNTENCTLSNPAADTWYISVRAYSAYSGLNIDAEWKP